MYIATNLKDFRDNPYSAMVNMDHVSSISIFKDEYFSKENMHIAKTRYILTVDRVGLKSLQVSFETLEKAQKYYEGFKAALSGESVKFENGDFILPLIPK